MHVMLLPTSGDGAVQYLELAIHGYQLTTTTLKKSESLSLAHHFLCVNQLVLIGHVVICMCDQDPVAERVPPFAQDAGHPSCVWRV